MTAPGREPDRPPAAAIAATAATLLTPASLTADDLAAVPLAVADRLRGARRVLAVCHENPEADALGAVLALAIALEHFGAHVATVCADPVPTMYSFLPGAYRIRAAPDPAEDYDLLVVLDCGELERVGAVLPAFADLFERVPIVNIDHHVSNTGFGEIDWIDTEAAATCEMLTLLVRVLGVPLTAGGGTLAADLLGGIVMDTATFQHPNTTPRTLRAAAELVAAGAPLSDLARLIYRTKPEGQLRLFGRVLARIESDLGGRLLWSDLLESDLEATGAVAAESEGLIDLLAQSETAEIALLFKEEPGRTRVSVRTRDGGPDATALVGIFGGGGHARAAGATVLAELQAARRDVLEAARRLIRGEVIPGDGAGHPEGAG